MLFTMTEYELFTQDSVSASATVIAAHDIVVKMAGEACGRIFAETTVTDEACLVHETLNTVRGDTHRVYPIAYPVTACTVPTNNSIDLNGRYIAVPSPTWDFLVEGSQGRFILTSYTGGYTVTTCPTGLKALLAELTYALIHNGITTTTGDAGPDVKQVSLGDASITYRDFAAGGGAAGCERLVPGIGAALAGWEKRT